MSLFSMKHKIVMVTGASSGLGKHFAITLAKAGADVILAARRTNKLFDVANEIKNMGRKALVITLDVTKPQSVLNGIAEAVDQMGQIHVLINSAGSPPFRKNILDYTESEWDVLIDTNLKGSWLVSQAVAKHMIVKNQGGSIINISSIMAVHTRPNALVYSVAKAGVSQMTRALALDLATHNIRVNAISPGWFVTDFNREFLATPAGQDIIRRVPLGRTGRLEELEGPLLLLASDASTFMTGTILTVDGGSITKQI